MRRAIEKTYYQVDNSFDRIERKEFEMLYCPVCLNKSLTVQGKGVVEITINGKHMDAGRFYYLADKPDQNKRELKEKIEEFFKWYSNFRNIDPIRTVQLVTSSAICDNNCIFKPNSRFSVVGILFSIKEVQEIIKSLGMKYQMKIEITSME